MYLRTYFDKDSQINKDSLINYGKNPIIDLYFGGSVQFPDYSRYLFHFDETKLLELYSNCSLGDLSDVKHFLRLTPAGRFGNSQLECSGSSYRLCLFRLSQEWEEGCGYTDNCEEGCNNIISLNCNPSKGSVNWFNATESQEWEIEGVIDAYSGDDEYLMCFDVRCDDEDYKIDVTNIVNDIITGDTVNYGFGLSFHHTNEIYPNFEEYQSVTFHSKDTNTFFQPYIETVRSEPIKDDRANFYINKDNTLILYTHAGGEPVNLDSNPTVNIYNASDELLLTATGTCLSNGVYGVELSVSGNTADVCGLWRDIWSNISINGYNLPDVEMEFEVKNGSDYYSLGYETFNPKQYYFSTRGVNRNENVLRGEVRKVFIDTRRKYVNEFISLDKVEYRIYVSQGRGEITVIDWTEANRGVCDNWFYLDTSWMLPQTYYLETKVTSSGEQRIQPDVIKFNIIENNRR
jgi:hypothetical protein